jgi:hypothetical protein
VDLAPEFPALDGDSGKTAGVVIFLSNTNVAALQTAEERCELEIFYAPETAGSALKLASSSVFWGGNFDAFIFERHVIPNSVNEAALSSAAELGVRDLMF